MVIRKLSYALIAGLLAMVVGCAPATSNGPTGPVAKTFSYTKSALGYTAITPTLGRSLNRAAGAGVGTIFSSPDTSKVLLTTDVLGTPTGIGTAAAGNSSLVAVLDPVTGFVTPVRNGSLTIVATDSASGDSATASLVVNSPVDLAASNALTSGFAVASAWRLVSVTGVADLVAAGYDNVYIVFAANCNLSLPASVDPADPAYQTYQTAYQAAVSHSNFFNAGTFYLSSDGLPGTKVKQLGSGQWVTVNGVLAVANNSVQSGVYTVAGNTLTAALVYLDDSTQTQVFTLVSAASAVDWANLVY